MKILFVDNSTTGHHIVYIRELVNDPRYESIVIIPEEDVVKIAGDSRRIVVI